MFFTILLMFLVQQVAAKSPYVVPNIAKICGGCQAAGISY